MRLDDFQHLPALADAFTALAADLPSLIVVAGLDLPGSATAPDDPLLPSGRGTIARVLADALLADLSGRAAVVAADAEVVRVPRALRSRIDVLKIQRGRSYASGIAEATAKGARLIFLDQLSPESAAALGPAVAAGARVLAQLNSAARGMALLRELAELGLDEQGLPERAWLVAVQRLPTLCPNCRRAVPLTPLQRLYLTQRNQAGLDPERAYFVAGGCERCQGRGYNGTVALFDICRLRREGTAALTCDAILSFEQYAAGLAEQGELSFDDAIDPEAAQARRIFRQFAADEQALGAANQALERKLAELHSANEVLQQRTAALLSLQTIGQALISSTDLRELAHRICRHVRELCGADLAALYVLDEDGGAAILAVGGWDAAYVGTRLDGAAIAATAGAPSPYHDWPPGIPQQHADVLGGALRAGLGVALTAEDQQVGMLIIHSTRRARFSPGETALLQTFAHQAALSIQRTRLIEQLNLHIAQLQAAQAALVEQERLAREMELAAEVQQSILPHVFPRAPGLTFAADNRPARQVGGDFYDVFTLNKSTIGLVIADVSGKGMPAALYMALTRSLLLAEARRVRSPRAVLLNVNRLLREVGDPQMFVTVFYGLLEVRSRRLTFARAGHDYPLLFRDGAAQQLTGAGTVLGMLDLEPQQLSEEQLELRPGDRLVLYTDGLIDVVDPAGRRLELPGLLELLSELPQADPATLCAATFAALSRYQGQAEQFDDMTMVVVGVD